MVHSLELSFTNEGALEFHIVGDGVQHRLLCQLTANATGRPVIAGPVEATALGNVLVQAMAHGENRNVAEARDVAARSFDTERYEPEAAEEWNKAYQRYKAHHTRSESIMPTNNSKLTLYIATEASDDHPGTIGRPLRTLERAVSLLKICEQKLDELVIYLR
ncbi:carbohydrate kinase of FGGY family protein [Cohnella phaseoli]|uniref:Carbohydrate kinase of FGGY family protein n=1 Tax=Cohnella phaseoli TaxID=456490 RepID=A0A3D9KRD2_9BACL|nr:carbohydrate kinase of FGGY family protein [Cohnella phaseoli]